MPVRCSRARALDILNYELQDVWGTDKSSDKKLVGRMSLRCPVQAELLIGGDDLFHSLGEDEVGEGCKYRLSFTRPYGFYPPVGLHELVVYAGGGCPFGPLEVVAALQPALSIYNRAHPKTPGSIDSPQQIFVAGAAYVRFLCSHPALATALSEVDIGNSYMPAFTYHTNANPELWKTKKMRLYSQEQKQAIDARRGSKRKRRPYGQGDRSNKRPDLNRSSNKPPTPQQKLAQLRLRISALEKEVDRSRLSQDGQVDKYSRDLVALQEELLKLSIEVPGEGVKSAARSSQPTFAFARLSSRQAWKNDDDDLPSATLQRTLTISPRDSGYTHGLASDGRQGEDDAMVSDDDNATSEAKRARLAYGGSVSLSRTIGCLSALSQLEPDLTRTLFVAHNQRDTSLEALEAVSLVDTAFIILFMHIVRAGKVRGSFLRLLAALRSPALVRLFLLVNLLIRHSASAAPANDLSILTLNCRKLGFTSALRMQKL